MVSRNEGLKLVVNALFSALPAMVNVMLVCGLFVLIFAILGINFFKGQFFHCEIDEAMLPLIDDWQDCVNLGGEWKQN